MSRDVVVPAKRGYFFVYLAKQGNAEYYHSIYYVVCQKTRICTFVKNSPNWVVLCLSLQFICLKVSRKRTSVVRKRCAYVKKLFKK